MIFHPGNQQHEQDDLLLLLSVLSCSNFLSLHGSQIWYQYLYISHAREDVMAQQDYGIRTSHLCHKCRSAEEKGNTFLAQCTGVLEEVRKFLTAVCLGSVLKLSLLEGFRSSISALLLQENRKA